MIHFSKLKSLTGAALLLLIINACQSTSSTEIALPSAGCAVAWADSLAMDFKNTLEAATKTAHPVWPGYALGDGAVVLDAGLNADSSKHCLGLWHRGQLIDYNESGEGLKLSTPLYGYQLSFDKLREDVDGGQKGLLTLSQQPDSIRTWLHDQGIKTAVVMPVDFPQFPFKIPTLTKVQLAIHESFHVEIMLRYWYTGLGQWPAWDKQPDRPASRQCYTLNDSVQAAFSAERGHLAEMIEALLNEDKGKAIAAGNAFLKARAKRYDLLRNVTINRQDLTQCDCSEAENIMELEEGLADYGSWTMLYEIGLADRSKLLQRYNAQQQEPFYLTGAMLMHAISLMNPAAKNEIIQKIITAPDHESGSLFAQFKQTLEAYSGS